MEASRTLDASRLLKNPGHSPALRDCATGNRKLLKKWHRLQPVARNAQVAKGFFSNLLDKKE